METVWELSSMGSTGGEMGLEVHMTSHSKLGPKAESEATGELEMS